MAADRQTPRDPIAAAYSLPVRRHDPLNRQCPGCGGHTNACECGGVIHRCEDGSNLCSSGCGDPRPVDKFGRRR